MIYSRSPEQYDSTPFVDSLGNRYSREEAPREAKWSPRLFLTPTNDIEPVMDLSHKRYSREAAELILKEDPKTARNFIWAPRNGEYGRHNQILSSIRNTGGQAVMPDLYRLWLQTIDEFHPGALIALSPGLDEQKIAEAKIVLSRLLRIHEEVL